MTLDGLLAIVALGVIVSVIVAMFVLLAGAA